MSELTVVGGYATKVNRSKANVRTTLPEDTRRWCLLRALEWNNWPIFLGQAVLPPFLLLFPWWGVLSALVVVNVIWSWWSDKFVKLQWAITGVRFVRLRWVISITTGTLLTINGNPGVGMFAAIWPLLIPLLIFVIPPSKAKRIQETFHDQLRSLEQAFQASSRGSAWDRPARN